MRIVRQLDALGRICVPKVMRKDLNIEINDVIEITSNDDAIILKKQKKGCVFCFCTDFLEEFGNKSVCLKCLSKLKKI